ncbi:transcriptional repressor [Mucilaginibacter rigui]|uniref:Transcriptional repressor n=1 Tax=Mucilaginibacter rigui TaxID=534635 RepID=A0ABR7X7J3_9SPHI|nr:transcriptional repressor [Mucilaginibacter rigui]MBD1386544.1 transcriptional repressor [Mucilaginibacter rigui]
MNYQTQIHRASKSRLTEKQKEYNRVNDLIVEFINTLTDTKDAEFLWLEITKKGYKMSITSFYSRLKKLVEAGLIIKIHVANNKFVYKSTLY